MSTTPIRVFAARLAGLPVFDPQGDQVGKVRDVVVVLRSDVRQPRVVGLVVEVFGRRQIFAPMTRVTNIDAGQVITTGLLNMRRFEKRSTETLVVGQMLDRKVKVRSSGVEGVVFDVAMEQAPDEGLGALPGRAHRGRQGLPQATADPRRGVGRRRGSLPGPGQPGRRPPDRLAGRAAPGRRRQRDPRAAARAPQPGRRRDGRRAARARPRGAARGGPGRDPRAPRLRARGRHPRGDVRRRRRRPDRRPPARDRADPARADGERGGRRGPATDGVRRGDRRRHDDARAGDPAAGRHRRRGPRPRAQRGPHALPGRAGARLPPTAGDADRQAPRRRPHPAPAA